MTSRSVGAMVRAFRVLPGGIGRTSTAHSTSVDHGTLVFEQHVKSFAVEGPFGSDLPRAGFVHGQGDEPPMAPGRLGPDPAAKRVLIPTGAWR
jgi:hypothetical protein